MRVKVDRTSVSDNVSNRTRPLEGAGSVTYTVLLKTKALMQLSFDSGPRLKSG
jgi:hypothetical protein